MKNTLLQFPALLTMLYGGILIGAVYDLFRLLRRIFHASFVQVLCDALFCAAFFILCALFLLLSTGGELRLYPVLGLLIGFILQQYSISALFFSLFHGIQRRLVLTRSRKSR